MKAKNIYFFIGTTAELIKLAPVIKEFKKRKIKFKIISSGQGKLLFKEFSGYLSNFKVDIAFSEKYHGSSVSRFIFWAIRTFIVSILELQNEFKKLNKKSCYFIVHGDTVSSLVGAFIAKVYRLNLVHIESGLRSFNFFEPFPEELCRFIISHLTNIHFCPNDWSVRNLRKHGGLKINTGENTLIETFWWAIRSKKKPSLVKTFKGKYFVLVLHRQEHVIFAKEWTKNVIEFILEKTANNLTCVFVTHTITSSLISYSKLNSEAKFKKKLILTPRLNYVDFMKLVNKSEFFITDGGSNQEEAYYLGKPTLILRNCTERTEGLKENVALCKGKRTAIVSFLKDYKKYERGMVKIRLRPSELIVNYLMSK